jgi:TPR repeat protein
LPPCPVANPLLAIVCKIRPFLAALAVLLPLAACEREPSEAEKQAYKTALDLLAADREKEILPLIEGDRLPHTPQAALLKGFVLLLSDPGGPNQESRRWLKEAADDGIAAAATLLGLLEFVPPCGDPCRERASRWFFAAKDRDPMARILLAKVWRAQGYPSDAVLALLEPLVDQAEDDLPKLMASVQAAKLIDSRGRDYSRMMELYRYAALQGDAAVWAAYGIHLNDAKPVEAEPWLMLAARHGNPHASLLLYDRLQEYPDAVQRRAAEQLHAIIADQSTQLGKAAQWCQRITVGSSRCEATALEDQQDCMLFAGAVQALGMANYEETNFYSNCRSESLCEHQRKAPHRPLTPSRHHRRDFCY